MQRPIETKMKACKSCGEMFHSRMTPRGMWSQYCNKDCALAAAKKRENKIGKLFRARENLGVQYASMMYFNSLRGSTAA